MLYSRKHSTLLAWPVRVLYACHMRPLKSRDIFKYRERVLAVAVPNERATCPGGITTLFRAVRELSRVQSPNEALARREWDGIGDSPQAKAKKRVQGGEESDAPCAPAGLAGCGLWAVGADDAHRCCCWSSPLFRSGSCISPFLPTSICGRHSPSPVCMHEPTQRHRHLYSTSSAPALP